MNFTLSDLADAAGARAEGDVVLFKASRSIGLERSVARLAEGA